MDARSRSLLSTLGRISLFTALLGTAAASCGQDLNSSNVFAGYSFLGANLFSGQHADLNGWNISAEKKYLPFFGVVGDVSGLYGSKDLPATCAGGSGKCLADSSIGEYTFDLGIRGSYGTKTVRPFAEALFGEVHTTENSAATGFSKTNNGFDSMLGAGIDCRVTRRLGCRVDVDYIVTGTFVVRHNSIRASTGLVFYF
ncbi:MAG: outer membrane beta-barrel protein [Candidatus Sulfotelmatobacter sp.]|jgi:hypothetical protein